MLVFSFCHSIAGVPGNTQERSFNFSKKFSSLVNVLGYIATFTSHVCLNFKSCFLCFRVKRRTTSTLLSIACCTTDISRGCILSFLLVYLQPFKIFSLKRELCFIQKVSLCTFSQVHECWFCFLLQYHWNSTNDSFRDHTSGK